VSVSVLAWHAPLACRSSSSSMCRVFFILLILPYLDGQISHITGTLPSPALHRAHGDFNEGARGMNRSGRTSFRQTIWQVSSSGRAEARRLTTTGRQPLHSALKAASKQFSPRMHQRYCRWTLWSHATNRVRGSRGSFRSLDHGLSGHGNPRVPRLPIEWHPGVLDDDVVGGGQRERQCQHRGCEGSSRVHP